MNQFDLPGASSDAPRLPFNVPFAEAIAWARARKAMLPDEFYGARLQAVRARSFAIAGLSALDQVQQVADSLAAATAAGQTMREWQKGLPASVFELGAARRELIFSNAVQTHYGIGRTIQQRENAAARPYLMWDAINDSRTRPEHRAMDGHIAPIDDPIWARWHPPAGHRCRCSRIGLTEAQARARGYPTPAPNVEPDKGWAGDPTEGNEDLVRIIQARQDACLTTFAVNKTRARGLWCDQQAAKEALNSARKRAADKPAVRQPQGIFTPYDITVPRGVPDTSTPARAALVRFEDEVRGAVLENGAAFDADGNLLLRKVGQPDRLGYTDAEMALMRGAHFSHNHPNGVALSVADVRMASRIGLAELRAVGPQFRYVMNSAGGWPTEEEIASAVAEARKNAQSIVQAMVIENGLSLRNASAELTHQIVVILARRLGLSYRREYT